MSNSIAVMCVITNEKIVNQSVLRVPSTATIAELKTALQRATGSNAKKAVQVLISGAAPSEATLIRDLAAVYASSEDGLLHVNYSVEGSFGAPGTCAVCTYIGPDATLP